MAKAGAGAGVWLLKLMCCVMRAMLTCGFLSSSILLFRSSLKKCNFLACFLVVRKVTKGVSRSVGRSEKRRNNGKDDFISCCISSAKPAEVILSQISHVGTK